MRAHRCLGQLLVALLVLGCGGRGSDRPTTTRSSPTEATMAEGDEQATPTQPPAPATGSATGLAIVDLCRSREPNAPVCALLDDGRVVCAHVQADRFEPPLAGIREAVEIACGEQGVCVREANGVVTCLDADGKQRKLDVLARARSLAPNCAVLERGAAACWDVDWAVTPVKLPRLAAALRASSPEALDLLRVEFESPRSHEHGCALHASGGLWCWGGIGNDGKAEPREVHRFERPEEVLELQDDGPRICWRVGGGWQCTDGESAPQPGLECDHGRCACEFGYFGVCHPIRAGESDAEMTVADVVMRTDGCAVDSSGRVWCQHWPGLPPTVMGLTLDGETTRLAAFEGEPPTPEPSPLPDPATAKCPAAARVVNQVCGPLRRPDAALACKPGARTCPCQGRLAWFDEDACDVQGFQFVDVAGLGANELSGWHTFVVHVDGDRVALGPELYLEIDDVDWGEAAMVVEVGEDADEGDMFHYWESELHAVVVCALVDGQPACSAPLTRDLDFTEGWGGHDDEEDTTHTIRYSADLQVRDDAIGVKVKAKHGKLLAPDLPGFEGLRFPSGGKQRFAKILDQRFVAIP